MGVDSGKAITAAHEAGLSTTSPLQPLILGGFLTSKAAVTHGDGAPAFYANQQEIKIEQHFHPTSPPLNHSSPGFIVGMTGAGKPTTSWNLPNSVDSFTGREKELEILKSALTNDGKGFISQHIVGLGGIGKTSLAVEYAKRSKDYDFIAFINANSQSSLTTEFNSLAKAFGMSQERIKEISIKDLIGFVYQKLGTQYNKMLLIFDDAIDLRTIRGGSDEKEQANFELPDEYENKIHWLITTKNQHFSYEIKKIKLEIFTPEEAREYVKKRLTNKENDISIDKLAKELECLPLALSYATAYIKMNSTRCNIEEYLRLFNTQGELKKLLDTDIDSERYKNTIYKAWKVSINALPTTSKCILEHCAFLASTLIPLSLVQSMDEGIHETDLNNALTELEKYSLVDSVGLPKKKTSGIILHSLLQKVIQLNITDNTKIITEVCKGINTIFWKDSFTKESILLHIQTLIKHLNDNNSSSISYQEENFGLLHFNIGWIFNRLLNNPQEAEKHFEKAVNIIKNEKDLINVQYEWSYAFYAMHNLENAMDKIQYAEKLKTEDIMMPIKISVQKAIILCDLQKKELAIKEYEKLLEKILSFSENKDIAWIVHDLSKICIKLNFKSKAIEHAENAKELYKKHYPDNPHVAEILYNLGDIYYVIGKYKDAKDRWEHAIKEFKKIDMNHPRIKDIEQKCYKNELTVLGKLSRQKLNKL